MNTRILGLAGAFALSLSGAALAQSAPSPQALVGHWLVDSQGHTVGSVRGLTDDGQTAIIMVGAYFQPGSHEARVPVSQVAVSNGKLTLRDTTVEALNVPTRR